MAVRHHNWTHVHVVGDHDQASAYLPEARKLLGQVIEDAQHNGLQTHQMTRRYQDGAVIVAEVRGGIPRVTIAPPTREGEDPQPEPPDDFVVWARTLAMPDGIDPEHPQQILKEPDGRRGSQWRSFVFNDDVPAGRRTGGTYGGMFPRGLDHAGNVDWVGEDGERISWYGPSARMFADAYVNPKTQYGKKVFMLGEVLFDADQYAADSPGQTHGEDRYILGAALKIVGTQAYLITVQTTGDDGMTPMDPIPAGEGRFTYPLANQAAARQTFYTYRLRQERDDFGVLRYHVVPESRVDRGYLQIDHTDPWFFDRSGSTAVTHVSLPAQVRSGERWWSARTADTTWAPEEGTFEVELPGWDQYRLRIAIDDNLVVTLAGQEAYSLVSGGPGKPVCSEFGEDGLRTYGIRLDDELVPLLQFDGVEVPLYRAVRRVEGGTHGTKRWILYASPRDQVVVFLVEDVEFLDGQTTPNDTTLGRGIVVEVWRRGMLVHEEYLQHPKDYAGGMVRYYTLNRLKWSSLRGHPIAPSFFIYGLVVCMIKLDNTQNSANADFAGANATYADVLRTSGSYFGTYDRDAPGLPSRPPTPLNNLARPGFASDRADKDGNEWVTACAASQRSVLVSLAAPVQGHTKTVHFVTDANLAEITGVGGAGERFHPIWQLGKPPKSLSGE